MRFALILALVGAVLLLHVDTAEARSGASTVQARKGHKQKAKKRHSSGTQAKSKAKTKHKGSKRSRKAPVEAVAVADETDTPAPAPEVVAPVRSRNAVAQVTDDEEPANAPKKKQ